MSAGTVVHLDFRDAPAEACEQEVRDRLRTCGRDGVRALVVDRVASLVDHDSAYRRIWASRLVDEVLCVAVGPPVDREAGLAVRATPVLNNQTAAMLWVGDVEDGSGLHTLLDLLRLPAVFERVIELADQFPNRVACPGHRVVAGQVTPAELAEARRGAVGTITNGGGRAPGRSDVASYRDILGVTSAAEVSGLGARSPLLTAFEGTRRACEQADRNAALLAGRFGPRFHDRAVQVWHEVTAAGRMLAELRDRLVGLFTRIDGRAGLDQARWDELADAGVLVNELSGTDRAAVAARLRDRALDGLDHGSSLSDLIGWLRGLASEATPVGSVARVPELHAACPDQFVDTLRKPAVFPWRVSLPLVLGVAVAGGCLAALGPLGLLTGPLLVVAWVAAVALATARQPRPASAGRARQVQYAVLWHLAAGGVGCVLGVVASKAVMVPVVVGLVLAVASAVGLAAVLRVWWFRAVSAWAAALGLHRGPGVVDELSRVLHLVAGEEWALSEPRRFVADASLTTVEALDVVMAVLAGSVADTPPGVSGDALRGLVASDLLHTVKQAMGHCWDQLRVGAVEDVRDGVRHRLGDLLADYTRHLAQRGIDEPFGEDMPARAALVNSLWQESPVIRGLLHDVPADRGVVPLCAPEDLSLLDQTVDRCRLVRIAPRAVRAVLDIDRTVTGVTWTASGHTAGVLRLVPLRAGAVTLAWPVTAGEQDTL